MHTVHQTAVRIGVARYSSRNRSRAARNGFEPPGPGVVLPAMLALSTGCQAVGSQPEPLEAKGLQVELVRRLPTKDLYRSQRFIRLRSTQTLVSLSTLCPIRFRSAPCPCWRMPGCGGKATKKSERYHKRQETASR